MTRPVAQVMPQLAPGGQRSVQPPVALHVAWQSPPSQSVSQPPRPLQVISEPVPTWKLQASVPLQLAVQSMPQAAVHPRVLLQVTTQ